MKESGKMIIPVVLSFIILLIPMAMVAQKAPVKFGNVDIAELEMKVYEADTSAEAVVLCDYGTSNGLQFTRHLRIKVLKKTGTSWVNQAIRVESQSQIKGCTYNIEGGGIVEDKLKRESIFKERVYEDYFITRITMPNVKVGSVVEVVYTIPGLPEEWRFQQEIPVIHSELRIASSPYINYGTSFFGFEPLSVTSPTRWVAVNMPALKEEPYMSSITNFLTKFEINLRNVNHPSLILNLTTSWNDVCKYFLDHRYFGGRIETAVYLTGQAKEITEKYSTPAERMVAAYEYVKGIKWDEYKTVFASTQNLNKVVDDKLGNSADFNFILYNLLRKLDFEVYPVALSTRDNGMLSLVNPTLNKFNYVIVLLKHEGKDYLLDATEKYLPFGLLPKRCLNWHGRIIVREKSDWIELKPADIEREIVMATMEMDAGGNLKGKIDWSRNGYAALNFRKEYFEFNTQDQFPRDFEKDYPGMTIEAATLNNLEDIYQPVKEEYIVTCRNQVQVLGEMAYINPVLINRMVSNPFKLLERKFPVDYGYPMEKTYILNLTFPEGYIVDELPRPVRILLPNNSGSFLYNFVSSPSSRSLQLTCKFEITKPLFLPHEYADLKEFYNQVIAKHAEMILLKKVNP